MVDESVADGLRAMGVSEEDIAAAQEQVATVEADYEVHEDCWDSVMLFQLCGTQWIKLVVIEPVVTKAGLAVTSRVVRQGLDFARVESVLRMNRVKPAKQPQLLADLYDMQHAVLRWDAQERLNG